MDKDKYYLTDKQYLDILQMIKKTVESPDFKPDCYDSTTIGDKYTESNCGLCNDNYTELGTALFPEEFKKFGRKSRKYRKENHRCPFDLRLEANGKDFTNTGWGCFYNCFLFGNGKLFEKLNKESTDVEYIRYLVRKTIKERR